MTYIITGRGSSERTVSFQLSRNIAATQKTSRLAASTARKIPEQENQAIFGYSEMSSMRRVTRSPVAKRWKKRKSLRRIRRKTASRTSTSILRFIQARKRRVEPGHEPADGDARRG